MYDNDKIIAVKDEFIDFSNVINIVTAEIIAHGHDNQLISEAEEDIIIRFEYIAYHFYYVMAKCDFILLAIAVVLIDVHMYNRIEIEWYIQNRIETT